jgi:hypothetical protein
MARAKPACSSAARRAGSGTGTGGGKKQARGAVGGGRYDNRTGGSVSVPAVNSAAADEDDDADAAAADVVTAVAESAAGDRND